MYTYVYDEFMEPGMYSEYCLRKSQESRFDFLSFVFCLVVLHKNIFFFPGDKTLGNSTNLTMRCLLVEKNVLVNSPGGEMLRDWQSAYTHHNKKEYSCPRF